jgi:hypothetical protein
VAAPAFDEAVTEETFGGEEALEEALAGEEVMVSVGGQMKSLATVTEEDENLMTPEEYQVTVNLGIPTI